ncbi:MAG: hypothetical protein AAF318_16500 [Pseudomonadota bacterium]
MTICIATRVSDAMVFAADSATTLAGILPNGQQNIVNVYNGGDKVFNLYRGLPIIAMTCGMGHIGERNIGSLSKELRLRLMSEDKYWGIDPRTYTIEQVAERAKMYFFDDRFQSQQSPDRSHSFEFWIGGYSSDSETHDLWCLTIVNGACSLTRIGQPGELGIYPAGQPGPVMRLLCGIDPQAADHLVAAGVTDPQTAAEIANVIRKRASYNLAAHAMPIHNAIELTRFLAETTKGFFHFAPGADVVGGDLDIAVVTRYEGFKWIARKHYYPAEINVREIDHAGGKNHPGYSAEDRAGQGKPVTRRVSLSGADPYGRPIRRKRSGPRSGNRTSRN